MHDGPHLVGIEQRRNFIARNLEKRKTSTTLLVANHKREKAHLATLFTFIFHFSLRLYSRIINYTYTNGRIIMTIMKKKLILTNIIYWVFYSAYQKAIIYDYPNRRKNY